jgi:hypothetical protein
MASPGGVILTTENAAPYVLDFTVIDLNQDGKISEHEFKNACHGGWVKDRRFYFAFKWLLIR